MGTREEARDLERKKKEQLNKQGADRARGAGTSTGGFNPCLFTMGEMLVVAGLVWKGAQWLRR